MEGQLIGSISNSYYADYFEHFGFARSDKADNLLSEIDKKFRIECRVQFTTDHKSGLVNITAKSPLVSTGYALKEAP